SLVPLLTGLKSVGN
ncbi:disulfide interchange protein DsbD, partial [Vibrio cholerae O1 str. Nep-21106]